MKTFINIFIILLFVVGCSACTWAADAFRIAVDRKTFLAALDQVESGSKDRAVGSSGERGRYQITERVWRQHTSKPFEFAHRRVFAHAIAERHYDWIVNQLHAANWPTDVESIASAWNAGLSATINNHISPATRDYAERVSNLYKALRGKGAS